jgi:hypothetical protein
MSSSVDTDVVAIEVASFEVDCQVNMVSFNCRWLGDPGTVYELRDLELTYWPTSFKQSGGLANTLGFGYAYGVAYSMVLFKLSRDLCDHIISIF